MYKNALIINSFKPNSYGGIEIGNIEFKKSVKPANAKGIVIIGRNTLVKDKFQYIFSNLWEYTAYSSFNIGWTRSVAPNDNNAIIVFV